MKRRRRSFFGTLDALLVVAANVAGVVLVMLAMTQMGASDAVRRMGGFETGVDRHELAELERRSRDLQLEFERKTVELDKLQKDAVRSGATKAEGRKVAAELKADVKKWDAIESDAAAARKLLAHGTAEIAELEKQLAQRDSERTRVKEMLEETPAAGEGPKAQVVHLPNPRAIPPGIQPLEFVCRYGRIMPLDVDRLRLTAQEEVNKQRNALAREGGIDCEKLIAMFEEKEIGNGYFRLKIKIAAGRPLLVFQARMEGDSTKQVPNQHSIFRLLLRRVDRRNQYLSFRVYPDSYKTYLAARQIADSTGFQAGWEPYPDNYEQQVDLGLPAKIFCSGYKPPPEPKAAGRIRGLPKTDNPPPVAKEQLD